VLIMSHRKSFILAVVLIATFATLAGSGTMRVQKDSVPKSQDRLALAEDEVKQLLMLIDTDKKGRISKRELMNFMEAEFERLDKD